MEHQAVFSEIIFPTKMYGGASEYNIGPGKLPALIASKPETWQVIESSVAAFLRGRYVQRRKGRQTRRGVKLRANEVRFIVDITNERRGEDEQGRTTFHVGSEETLSIHKTIPA